MDDQNPRQSPPPLPPYLPESQPQTLDTIPQQSEEPTPFTPVAQSQRSGCFWGIAGGLGCVLILMLPFVVAIVMGLTTINGIFGSIQGIFNPQIPTVAQVSTTQTIVNSVQPLGQLVSVSAQLAKAEIKINIQQGTLNSCGFSADHVAQGTIEAGIDFTSIDESAILYNEVTDTYTIVLPPAQLTSCRVDFIRQYNRSFTTCAVDWDEARVLADYTTLTDFRDDAVEGGILQRAQQEVRVIVGNFVQALTGSNVEITFAENPATPNFPASCTPDIPQNWAHNDQTGEWIKR